jgi:hypothetical protein
MLDDLRTKRSLHETFWRGEGPSLLLIPPGVQELYDLHDYPARFRDPGAMWKSEIARAEPVVDWPTDGIATVRPNLGVIFVPAMAGQTYRLPQEAMPWPGEPMTRGAIRAARDIDIAQTETMQLAAEFYAVHRASGRRDIVAYHADTQGVFDIAHLLYGEAIFYDLADPNEADWIAELLDICHCLYVQATEHLKSLLAEPADSMVHGHGTSQGVYFPHAGTRTAEDTAILLSPTMIEGTIVPTIKRAVAPFGRAFVHFCGNHKPLLERLCGMDEVGAIDLGNPEMYDARWVLEQCARTGTVLYSRLAADPDEPWRQYVRRLGRLVQETGARAILRPVVVPDDREACREMLEIWHELTHA